MTSKSSEEPHATDLGWKSDAFGERLREALSGRTSYSMEKETGISQSLIRKYMSGLSTPGADKLVALARATGVSVDWLATGEGAPHAGSGEEDGPALDNEARPGKGPERRAETRMEERDEPDEIREIESPTDTVKDEMGSYPLEEEPIHEIQGASIAPFIPELSDALMDPARRHAAGAEQEKDKRLWITMKAYSVLWELYQRNVDALVDLTEEDVEPIVEGIARAYDNLLGQWGEG